MRGIGVPRNRMSSSAPPDGAPPKAGGREVLKGFFLEGETVYEKQEQTEGKPHEKRRAPGEP